jgi:hypothetical protein
MNSLRVWRYSTFFESRVSENLFFKVDFGLTKGSGLTTVTEYFFVHIPALTSADLILKELKKIVNKIKAISEKALIK